MSYPRVGHINFLNCLPLTYSLQQDGYAKGMQVIPGVPAVLNHAIVNHRLDVSPVSSIVYARLHEELVVLPDVCIRADGEVQSIILVSRKPIGDLRDDKVVLTAKSATSHCLLKIILGRAYGARPNYYIRHVGVKNPVPEDAAAALLIGDDALYVHHHPEQGLYYYDLGKEWEAFTGKCMVYAVWVADRKFAAGYPELLQLVYDRILRGFQNGCQKKSQAIRSVLADRPFTFEELSAYLDVIRWDFDAQALDALTTFYRLAHEMNLIDHMPDIRQDGLYR